MAGCRAGDLGGSVVDRAGLNKRGSSGPVPTFTLGFALQHSNEIIEENKRYNKQISCTNTHGHLYFLFLKNQFHILLR